MLAIERVRTKGESSEQRIRNDRRFQHAEQRKRDEVHEKGTREREIVTSISLSKQITRTKESTIKTPA